MVWKYTNVKINGKTKMRHRLVMETYLGRKLRRDEIVHHKNQNKKDDRLKNLEIMSLSKHSKKHMLEHWKLPGIKEKYSRLGKKYGFQPTRYKKGRYWCNGCKKYLSKNNFWINKYDPKYKIRTYCKKCDSVKERLKRRLEKRKDAKS